MLTNMVCLACGTVACMPEVLKVAVVRTCEEVYVYSLQQLLCEAQLLAGFVMSPCTSEVGLYLYHSLPRKPSECSLHHYWCLCGSCQITLQSQ